jgi:hypothetical protein
MKHKKKECKGTISWQATQIHGFQLPCPFANKGCNGRRREEVDMALHIEKEHNAPTTWFRCIVPNFSSAVSGKPYKARGIRAHMDKYERHGHARYTSADHLAPIKTSAPQNTLFRVYSGKLVTSIAVAITMGRKWNNRCPRSTPI